MRIAQILWGKAHWITESDTMPIFPPDPQGNPIVLVDITGQAEVQAGWLYDADTGLFSEPPIPEPLPDPEPTDTELLMQAMADQELRDLEAQQERQLLAQQMADLELLQMGDESHV